ncbi:decaprenyl-phosphate phosphoribosyltransferase [Catellatospora citrea]|uniref:Decaprenyl-phosphate phosphoribosyltransferase n=2 Tax=Catellatospora citrea TaxID=53366 RepID=A0A8J3KGD1_9ACTN|nr:4-hydroxybenzoate polyprenyltransferase [Catellatospora citrea]GIF98408.1 decaprenyl-phosphate phosphoribosyltransferase [Catellatospora citrea]
MLSGMIRLMRPKHYLKNALILLPLVFARQLDEPDVVLRTLIGVLAFSAVASVVYIINDLRDVRLDREHPVKRNRPIASGAVPVPVAVAQAAVLIPLAAALSWLAGSGVVGFALLAGYVLINVAYSFGLKHVPILDVTILAVGFVIRVYYGADIADITVSEWFYLTMFAFSFFVSFGKRRNEILQTGTATRIANARYVPAFLDKAMYLASAVTVVFYSLWTIDSGQGKGLIWTVPLVLVIFLVYILRVEQPDQDGDPTDVVTGSATLLSLLAVYAGAVVVLLYGV